MADQPFIRLPLVIGRVHEDHLSAVERTFADALADFPPARLAAIFREASSVQMFRVELEILGVDVLPDEGSPD